MSTNTTTEGETTTETGVTTSTMIIVGPGYSLLIPEDAEKRKAALIASSTKLVQIVTEADALEVHAEIKALAKIRGEIEKGRELVKAPVLQLGRDIDAKAKDFGATLKAHEDRLTELLKDHNIRIEQARLAEVERLRKLDQARIAAEQKAERERAEAQRRKEQAEAEAEEIRLEAERVAKKAQEAANQPDTTEEDEINAQLEQARLIDEQNAREAEARRQAEADRQAEIQRQQDAAARLEEIRRISALAPRTTPGVKFPLAFEVTDIAELYRTHPHLVNLIPKLAEITAMLKVEETKLGGQIPTVPGLRVFRDAKVGKR